VKTPLKNHNTCRRLLFWNDTSCVMVKICVYF